MVDAGAGEGEVLTTERLLLRPFRASDGDLLFTLYGDARVMAIRKIGLQTRAQSDAQLAEILDHWRTHGFGLYAVIERTSGRFLGECGLRRIAPDDADIELSYGLVPEAWGKGYGSEASAAVLAHGLGRLGLATVYAIARADNARSRRVMEKLGFRFEKEWSSGEKRVVRYVIDAKS